MVIVKKRTESTPGDQALLEGLVASMLQLPGIDSLELQHEPVPEFDALIKLTHDGQEVAVGVQCKAQVYPKAALSEAYRARSLPGTHLLAAPSLSPESRHILKENRVGYWDSGGSLYLELPWGLYYVDYPPPTQPRLDRVPKNLYRGRTTQVLHTLLLEPDRDWKVSDLAESADVSLYTAHQVLDHLEKQLWVDKSGRGPQTVRRLTQPGKLLDDWASRHQITDYQVYRFHRLIRGLAAQESALFGLLEQASICEEWALTLEHGAQRVAPFVHHVPAAMVAIVPADIPWAEVAPAAGFRSVDEGENFVFLASKERTPFLGRMKFDNAWVASPIQLYIDLFAWPRRGREQARHLRSQVLGF